MLIVKRINNDAVLCVDAKGSRVVALGPGLAGAKIGEELDLSLVKHTFYDVDPRYVDLLRDLSLEYLELAAQVANVARGLLSYNLSPNLEVALADHIQFAVQRMQEHVYLSAPMAFDLQQNYPLEYKIAQYALRHIRETIGVELPHNEESGIAMCLINSACNGGGGLVETRRIVMSCSNPLSCWSRRSWMLPWTARALVLPALPRMHCI